MRKLDSASVNHLVESEFVISQLEVSTIPDSLDFILISSHRPGISLESALDLAI